MTRAPFPVLTLTNITAFDGRANETFKSSPESKRP